MCDSLRVIGCLNHIEIGGKKYKTADPSLVTNALVSCSSFPFLC